MNFRKNQERPTPSSFTTASFLPRSADFTRTPVGGQAPRFRTRPTPPLFSPPFLTSVQTPRLPCLRREEDSAVGSEPQGPQLKSPVNPGVTGGGQAASPWQRHQAPVRTPALWPARRHSRTTHQWASKESVDVR